MHGLALTATAFHIQNCVGLPTAGFLVDSYANMNCFMKVLRGHTFHSPSSLTTVPGSLH